MMEFELARQGLSPNRTFSDGTAVPDSFDSIHARHTEQRGAIARTADVSGSHERHRGAVSTFDNTPDGIKMDTAPSTLRDDVRGEGARIRTQTEKAHHGFEENAQIVETEDGTLASRKSLGMQSGGQVLQDGRIMAEEAKEATQSLYQRAKEAIKKRLDGE